MLIILCYNWFVANPHCRDGVEWFFVKLHEKKVPVLIISGGLGGKYIMKMKFSQTLVLFSCVVNKLILFLVYFKFHIRRFFCFK